MTRFLEGSSFSSVQRKYDFLRGRPNQTVASLTRLTHSIALLNCSRCLVRILFICLFGLVALLQRLLLGISARIIYKATNVNGYLAIVIGAGFTMVVQSSSITTSALTPLCGIGLLRLEQMYALTLGANLGTTGTAIMASMVANGQAPLQVALANLLFNVTGVVLWYPIPVRIRRSNCFCYPQRNSLSSLCLSLCAVFHSE